ncbi:hypothetical protein IMSHALPRED_004354 [Imshaugia aleurites]|uniref:Uncharacterized protein n=1 Tax=Imshaugia aleurites TaxID=172621 RepID=A0A8H3J8P7_9LECA|nr:hypothetical protein IMSHALPRED_004354 [Imshaugia aleurites]
MRLFLKSPQPIELYPGDFYINHSWGFGTLGILTVSKHLSAFGLSVLYGENDFCVPHSTYPLEPLGESNEDDDGHDDDDDVDLPVSSLFILWTYLEALTADKFHQSTQAYRKSFRWSNLRNEPTDVVTITSGVDCLDLISQTPPGQGRLSKLHIMLSHYTLMLFLGGSLLRILRRLRGLQSLKLEVGFDWDKYIPKSSRTSDWPERFGRDFLILTKEELGYIKTITLDAQNWSLADHIYRWISHELEKRNGAWAPPPPPYMRFSRTSSSMSRLHPEIVKLVIDAEIEYKPEEEQKRVSYLEKKYGVFP